MRCLWCSCANYLLIRRELKIHMKCTFWKLGYCKRDEKSATGKPPTNAVRFSNASNNLLDDVKTFFPVFPAWRKNSQAKNECRLCVLRWTIETINSKGRAPERRKKMLYLRSHKWSRFKAFLVYKSTRILYRD